MKRIGCVFGLLMSFLGLSQSPEKISYQAVIRDANNNLVTNTAVGVEVAIVKSSPLGIHVYIERHLPTSNSNGLITLQIGSGNNPQGNFSTIDWSDGPYFLSTAIDLTGGSNYSINSTTELLSVPYALHARTADSLAGYSMGSGLGGALESDPIFNASLAAGLSPTDTSYWNQKQSKFIAGNGLTWAGDTLNGLDTSQVLLNETDPRFDTSVAAGITDSDTAYWNSKQKKLIAGRGVQWVGDTLVSTVSGTAHDFYLGQDTLGGIVFHVYIGSDGMQHGLIVSYTEGITLWSYNNFFPGASSSWDGAANTVVIGNKPAANFAKSFGPEWYLPAINELRLLMNNLYHVNQALELGSHTLISLQSFYFSSTEVSPSVTYGAQGSSFFVTQLSKTLAARVRGVRSF